MYVIIKEVSHTNMGAPDFKRIDATIKGMNNIINAK
jgi:hypothetical protein